MCQAALCSWSPTKVLTVQRHHTRVRAAFKREYRRRHDDSVDEYIGKFKSSGRINRREVREYESILRQRAFAASVLDIRALPVGRSDFQVYCSELVRTFAAESDKRDGLGYRYRSMSRSAAVVSGES